MLHIDDSLIEEARRIGGHKTKKEAVTKAVTEYITNASGWQFLTLLALSTATQNTITRQCTKGSEQVAALRELFSLGSSRAFTRV